MTYSNDLSELTASKDRFDVLDSNDFKHFPDAILNLDIEKNYFIYSDVTAKIARRNIILIERDLLRSQLKEFEWMFDYSPSIGFIDVFSFKKKDTFFSNKENIYPGVKAFTFNIKDALKYSFNLSRIKNRTIMDDVVTDFTQLQFGFRD